MSGIVSLLTALPQTQNIVPGAPVATFNARIDDFDPDVVSHWECEEPAGSTLTDRKGTQNGTITGSPERSVQTIVQFDDVASGALIDGTCMALPGTTQEYFEVPDNLAFATSQGAIAAFYQRDAAPEKSTLVAKGANGVAGEWSVECNADGSPTAYLRDSGAVVRRITLDPGRVVLDEAYCQIFKWGPAGLSLSVWDEQQLLQREKLTGVTDGTAGTSPIRIGLWHSGISSHDGPIAHIVFFDRQITDQEEALIALPKTIVHEQVSPPVQDGLSEDPPENASVWVAPGGTASWPGTPQAPMGNIAAAIRGSSAGDVIAVAHGGGDWDYEEAGEAISSKNGTASNPIQVIGYGTRRPRIDLSIKRFRNGTDVSPTGEWTQIDAGKNIWQSTDTFSTPTGGVAGFGAVGDGNPAGDRLRLLPYNLLSAFENTSTTSQTNGYCGPGMIFDNSRIKIRTQTAMWSADLGHGTFPTEKDPNKQDIVVFELAERSIWTFTNCSHIQVQNIDFLYANACVRLNNSPDMTFERCMFRGEEDYFNLTSGSHRAQILRCQFHFDAPNYKAWRDWKQGTVIIADFAGRASIACKNGGVEDVLIQNCEFFGDLISIWCTGASNDGWRILNNEWRRCRDDTVDYDPRVTNMEIAYNWIHDRSQWFIGFSSSTTSPSIGGSIYCHHNLIDISRPYFYERDEAGTAFSEPTDSTNMSGERLWLGHLGQNPPADVLLKFYHNTVIGRFCPTVERKGLGITPNRGWATQSAGVYHGVFNNILIQAGATRPIYLGFFAVHKHNHIDGNLYHRTQGSGNAFTEVDDGSSLSSYTSLAAAKADTTMINASKTFYSPGFEAEGVEANPQFAGGAPAGTFDFATRASYLPAASAATSGAKDLRGLGFPGPQEAAYQAWRGALNPSGDGSEVGIQP